MINPTIRPFQSTDSDWLVEAHARIYAAEEGFDSTFGPLVRTIVEDFMATHDPAVERGWVVQQGATRLGSIFCVRAVGHRAKLRLFLLEPHARGSGLGRKLLDTCMKHAQSKGFTGMDLWTHESHRAACALYARFGWRLTHSEPVTSFGQELVEQNWSVEFPLAQDQVTE